MAIVLPSLIIMLSICKAYFWLSKRFKGNPYFEQTLRMLRFAVLGLIASAALLLIKPTNFIDTTSWIIFSVVAFLTVLPNFIKKPRAGRSRSSCRTARAGRRRWTGRRSRSREDDVARSGVV